jgi:fructose-bisphosphate aldolase class II
LVLHGSSGLADDELRRAVAGGLTKINIGTLLNRAFTASVRAGLAANPELVDPRRYLGPARDEMAAAVAGALLVLTGGA